MPSVYLLTGAAPGKVRICRARRGRLRELGRVETVDPARYEKHLHSVLEPLRVSGTREWFTLTHEAVAEAVAAAETWAADDLARELQAAELAKAPSDGRLVEPSAHARNLYEELRRLRAEEYKARVRRLRVENELRVLIGGHDGIEGIASWKSQTQRRFQLARFRSAYPDLYESLVEPFIVRPFRLR